MISDWKEPPVDVLDATGPPPVPDHVEEVQLLVQRASFDGVERGREEIAQEAGILGAYSGREDVRKALGEVPPDVPVDAAQSVRFLVTEKPVESPLEHPGAAPEEQRHARRWILLPQGR